jgi:hypothetical protein
MYIPFLLFAVFSDVLSFSCVCALLYLVFIPLNLQEAAPACVVIFRIQNHLLFARYGSLRFPLQCSCRGPEQPR